VRALYVPRIANCCTGSLRSRRAFRVAEAMRTDLWTGWLSHVLGLQPLCRMCEERWSSAEVREERLKL
jgi:hypothetical protein